METPDYIKVGAAVRLRNGEKRTVINILTNGMWVRDNSGTLSKRKLNGNAFHLSEFDIVGPWLDK